MGGHLLESIKAYLRASNWTFTQVRQVALLLRVPGKNGQLLGLFHVHEEQEQVTFEVGYTFQVPEPRRVAAAELLARLNYPLTVGAFQMDFDDGEVSYKFGLDLTGTSLTPALIRPMLVLGLAAADAHLPAIAALSFAGLSPRAAYDLCEQAEPQFTVDQAIAMASDLLDADE